MTLRRRLYLQFGLAVLPLLLLLAYQATTRSDLPQRVSAALAAYDLALGGADGFKDFVTGVADAIDTGRVGSGAVAALDRAREAEASLAATYPEAKPIAEGLAKVHRAVAANPSVATVLPLKAELQALRTAVAAALEKQRGALTALVDEERKSATVRERIVAAGGVAAIAVVLFMAYVLRRVVLGITVPLDASMRVARSIAGGRLDNQVAAHGNDEVGRLLQSVEEMQDHLAMLVREVRGRADSVSQAAGGVAGEISALSRRTDGQAASLEETAASMEQLGTAVRENNSAAQHADRLAREASAAADEGARAVSAVQGTMDDITSSSRRIGDIVGIIDAVAFQTNILALNAAVEAARAGEHGRGFAVVASEVRALSQRCASAAGDIKQVVATSMDHVEAGARRAADASRAIAALVEGVKEVSALMGQIAGASRQQEQGIALVGTSVGEMDGAIQQNAAASQKCTAAAERLRRDAEALAAAASRFTLPETVARNDRAAPSSPDTLAVDDFRALALRA